MGDSAYLLDPSLFNRIKLTQRGSTGDESDAYFHFLKKVGWKDMVIVS